jgi:ribonucleoside-diphosphate reductase beta chain
MSNKDGLLLGEDIAGVNRILPHKHKLAWDLFLKGCANNWMPTEISMREDINQWKTDLISEDEKLLVKRCLGFFAGSESLVANNLLLSAFKYVTDPECRQYILRQAYEESLHNLTIVYICDSLSLDVDEVYRAYETIPSIKAKDDFLMNITSDLSRNGFSTESKEGKREFLKNLFTYYIICEGTFFFSGFAMLLALGRQNKLQGISDQIKYTLRDESIHIEFGVYLINTLISQNPGILDDSLKNEFSNHIKSAVELEIEYAKDVLPTGILGLNSDMFVKYMQYIGNRRLESINLDFRFDSDENPFSWMSEVVDTQAMTNFFERRVREYQQSGSLEDDF